MRPEIVEEIGFRVEYFISDQSLTKNEINELRAKGKKHYFPGQPFTPLQIETIDEFISRIRDNRAMGPDPVPGFGLLKCRVGITQWGAVTELYGDPNIASSWAKLVYPVEPEFTPDYPDFQKFPGTRAVIQYSWSC